MTARLHGMGGSAAYLRLCPLVVLGAWLCSPVFADPAKPCQIAKLISSDIQFGDAFGTDLDLAGDVLIIGASEVSDRVPGGGAVYVHRRRNGNWEEEAKLFSSDTIANASFGSAVAVDVRSLGSRFVVGAVEQSCDDGFACGEAYVFERVGGQWRETARLKANVEAESSYFGSSVAIDGDVVVAGAPGRLGGIGSAYVYEFNGFAWRQTQLLVPSVLTDDFGCSVATTDGWIVVGGPGDDQVDVGAGAVFVYRRSDGSWVEHQQLRASDPSSRRNFGWAVSYSCGRLLIGAMGPVLGGPGRAYVFELRGDTWVEDAILVGSGVNGWDAFGYDVDLIGDVAVVGAFADTEFGPNAGAVYVFRKVGDGNWVEEAKLQAADAGPARGAFGLDVGLSDNSIVVSSGDDEPVRSAGSVYVFLRGEVLGGNVGTGDGSPASDVLFLDGSSGDECRSVDVTAGRRATLSIEPAPSSGGGGGAYAVWILDGGLAAGALILWKRGETIYDLGTGVRCLPIANISAAGSCPCPLTFPMGVTSQLLRGPRAARLCLPEGPGRRPAPVEFTAVFPPGEFLIGGLVEDRNGVHSPAVNVSIANWILVRSR